MNSGNPYALINGIDKFGAKELAVRLMKNNINVFGVGEELPQIEGENIKLSMSLEQVDKPLNYVFDMVSEAKVWRKAGEDAARLAIVSINENSREKKNILEELRVNWRVVEARGVYGPGMEKNPKGVEFLITALTEAVGNKNLTLPGGKTRFRLISVSEVVEALVRATLLSSTQGQSFLVVGREVSSETVATALIDEAKMTKFKVIQSEVEKENYDEARLMETQKLLRWQPEERFKDGIKETLQYFFTKTEQEKRGKKKTLNSKVEILKEKEEKQRGGAFEVMVEEALEEIPKFPQGDFLTVAKDQSPKEKEEIPVEMEEIEEEEETIGRPVGKKEEGVMEVRNSNSRKVAEVEEVIEKPKIQTLKPKTELEKKKQVTSSKRKVKMPRWGWLVLIILLILWPVLGIIKVAGTVGQVGQIKNLIVAKRYDEATLLADKTVRSLGNMDEGLSDWGINRTRWGRNVQEVARALKEVSQLEKTAADLAKSVTKMEQAIFKDKTIDWGSELAQSKTNLERMESQIGVLQSRLSGDWTWLPAKFRQDLKTSQRQLAQVKKTVELSNGAISLIPEIIGTDGKRREYMVLFQNETELRPGGGFIGSYGILSFEGGKLLNLEIKDIYEADGQLKGHVEPPPEIKNILGEANWYMRDANWQASFVGVGKDIQWFLEKETGRKVDGVVGIDLAVARSILGVVGEVYVPDFKEKINKNNLYEQAEFYSETNSFPGSNQKASFLGSLGKQLFESIKNLRPEQNYQLYAGIIDLLERNEIRMSFNQAEAIKTVAGLGWDGALYSGKCGSKNCLADYLYVVEANLGVNKANYFLYRNMEEAIDISQNSVGRVVKINYENTAKNTNWPGGDYKNYIRVYLPVEVNLAEVSISETGKPETKKIYGNEVLKVNQVYGKKEVGFLATIPVMKKMTVELRYTSNINLTGQSKFSYLHYVQKQPGFGDTGLVTLVSFPDGWQPTQVEPEASLVGGKVLFNQKLDGDIKMGVEIAK